VADSLNITSLQLFHPMSERWNPANCDPCGRWFNEDLARLANSKSLQFLPPSNPCFFNGQCVTEMKSGTCRHSATVGHSGPRVSKCSEHASLPPCRNALCWACGSIVASWKYVGTQIECLRNDNFARYRQHSTTKCGDRLEGSKLNRTSPVLSRWTHVTGPGICGR
jgi:hypothetical protein